MEAGIMIFNQIIKMFIMMMAGYLLYKKKLINDDTTVKLSNILLMVATPCTIITSFNQAYSSDKLIGLFIAFALSALVYIVNIIAAKIFYRGDERIERFSLVFSNAGFMGIPLVTGLLGAEAVFYLSPFIVCFYLFMWTYGVVEMSGSRASVSIKKIITNPCIWAVLIGLAVFMLPIKPFAPVMDALAVLGSMNTPMAMIVLGAYLAKEKLFDIFNSWRLYLVSCYRLVVLPMLYVFLFALLPISLDIKTTILIGASAPVGVLVAVFAQMFDLDAGYGAKIVCLSTILSLLTLPLLLITAEIIW